MFKKFLVGVLFISLTIGWATENQEFVKNNKINTKYSIGMNYSPFIIDIYKSSSSGFEITWLIEGNASVESYLQYSINNKLSMYFNLSYKDSDTRQYHKKSYTSNSTDQIEGYEINSHTTSLKPIVGLKYYLISPKVKKVSPLISCGIGKQFFNIEYSYRDFEDQSLGYEIIKDTRNDYDEGINSPFIVQVGFGAEYYLNESLSFTINTIYEYLKIVV